MFQFILILSILIIIVATVTYLDTPIETFASNQTVKMQLAQLAGVSPDRICNIHYNNKNKNKELIFNIIDSPVKSLNEVKNELDKMTDLKYTIEHKENAKNTYTKVTTSYTNFIH